MQRAPTALRDLLRAFGDAGYEFRPFESRLEGPALILRHDVDFSLEHALNVAREEKALGIAATFFFMLSSPFYNLLSKASANLVQEIRDLGHTVSMHFDPTAFEDLDQGFAAEKALFETLFKVDVEIISLHRPRGFLADNNRKLFGVRHTYEDEFFRDMAYLSDSGGVFSHGHPLQSAAFAARQPIHLLLHPIWWSADGDSPSDKLRNWQRQRYLQLHEEIGKNCKTFDGRLCTL